MVLLLEPGTVISGEEVGVETIRFRTNRVRHPVLVKVSYHPRWRVEGADGPYLVSPALMMVVPRQEEVRLVYPARTLADYAGLALTTVSALGLVFRRRLGPRLSALTGGAVPTGPPVGFIDACDLPPERVRRWGGLIPAAILLLLVASRLFSGG